MEAPRRKSPDSNPESNESSEYEIAYSDFVDLFKTSTSSLSGYAMDGIRVVDGQISLTDLLEQNDFFQDQLNEYSRGGLFSGVFLHPAYVYDVISENPHPTWLGPDPAKGLAKTISGAPLFSELNAGLNSIEDPEETTRKYNAAMIAANYASCLLVAREIYSASEEDKSFNKEGCGEIFKLMRNLLLTVSDDSVKTLDYLVKVLETALSPRLRQRTLRMNPKHDVTGFQEDVVYASDMLGRGHREEIEDAMPVLQGASDAMKALLAPRHETVHGEGFSAAVELPSRLDAAFRELSLLESWIKEDSHKP